MWPRLPESGFLGVLTKYSAGRRPAVSPARVWRNGLLYSAQAWLRMGSKLTGVRPAVPRALRPHAHAAVDSERSMIVAQKDVQKSSAESAQKSPSAHTFRHGEALNTARDGASCAPVLAA